MLKGIVRIETEDIATGEITSSTTRENFIFFENYTGLWVDNSSLVRPCIIGRGTDVYPYYDKNKDYFGRNQTYLTGYAPTGTQLNKFYQKTEDSPAYWDFYSLFLPPSSTATIPAIGLTTMNSDNTTYSNGAIGDSLYTTLNLDPYCYQSPTEYLNVYYRLILVEDEENESPDFIRNQMVMDIGRGTSKVVFPNTDHKTYPFRIEQDMTKNGYVNFLSTWGNTLTNKITTYPAVEHAKLRDAQKTYTYPDDNPNQYTQINYGYVNTVIRGFGNAKLTSFSNSTSVNDLISGIRVGVNPIKITPAIGENFTGIGNVFASSKTSSIPMFDAANFPAGSGRMQASGVMTNPELNPFPSEYQIEIVAGSQSMNGATYRVYEMGMIGGSNTHKTYALPLLPGGEQWQATDYTKYENEFKALQYKTQTSVHYSRKRLVKYIENRAFITWDKTGITIYDIYYGKLEVFDDTTTPKLSVTNVNDVKVDTLGVIWISCADTGLWKLHLIDDNTVELTHIGILPGSQQKCYAIDVDNFGNIYAIFWGTGLFYSSDGGVSWVNVAIDYPPFSGFESGGFVSKWSYVARMICNPERKATDGVGQLLILMSDTSPDYAASGGCWYDYQSQLTTGITNTLMKSQLATIRANRYSQNVQVSDNDNTWFFLVNGYLLYWTAYQGNASMAANSYTNTGANGSAIDLLDKEWTYDPVAGELKEQLYLGMIPITQNININTTKYVDIFDIKTKTQVIRIPYVNTSGGIAAGNLNQDGLGCSIKLGKNLYVTHSLISQYASNITKNGFYVHTGLGFAKGYRQWNSVSWGWNGSQWVKNHLGNRPLHATPASLFRGAQIKFTDGHSATTSWIQGDTFTFSVFDGFFKDNSSTMALRDTVYYKPTDLNEAFTPNFVTRVDNTAVVGVVNQQPIEIDWNINDLPDTTYSGGSVIINGDPYYNNVSYLALFNDTKALQPSKGEYLQTIGTPVMDNAFKIFNESCVKLDGESGFVLDVNNVLPPTTTFTIEMMIAPESTGTKQHLLDFRNATNTICAFYISTEGKLAVEIGGTAYGNQGSFLFPGTIYSVAFTRTGNTWDASINGVVQWTFTNTSTFPETTGLSVFKRWQLVTGSWQGFRGWASNVRITRAIKRNVSTVPSGFFPDFGNSYSGASLVLSGTYNNGSIVSKRELVGDWEVIFRGVTSDILGSRRSRPKLAFGVSVLKNVESVTDISYRICGLRANNFLQTYSQGAGIDVNTIAVRITKINNFVNVYVSNDGTNWSRVIADVQDLNPLHHICFWQVQADVAPMTTPSVEIIKNGSAIFSKVGAGNRGYYADKFLAADVYYPSDIDISLQGIKVSKARSNYLDPALPLEGEVLALMGGTLVFHQNDIGKAITGRIVTLRD